MSEDTGSLAFVYDGWDSYQESLVKAIAAATPEQLRFRPSPEQRSVGENALHIGETRAGWFEHFLAEEGAEAIARVNGQKPAETETDDPAKLVAWLNASWELIDTALHGWRVEDLEKYRDELWEGKHYALTRQWLLWHLIAHDLQHGGEVSFALGAQGLVMPELGDEGGHMTQLRRLD